MSKPIQNITVSTANEAMTSDAISTANEKSLDSDLNAKQESQNEAFLRKRAKLLSRNPRLNNKSNQQNISSSNSTISSSIYHKSLDDLTQSDRDWMELIELLSTKDLVLSPHELYEYMALLIKTFAGTNTCIPLSAQCKNDPNTKIKTIELTIPIISNNPAWNYCGVSDKSGSDSILTRGDRNLVFGNVCSMGIIDKRRQLQKQNVDYYRLNPVFLNRKYEWMTMKDKLYFSTMYKDYRIIGDNWFKKTMVDNTYRGTRNINDAIIIQNNKYGYLVLFTTKSGIFYTDPRVKYRDIKRPFDDEIEDNLGEEPRSNLIEVRETGKLETKKYIVGKKGDNVVSEWVDDQKKHNENAMNVSINILSNEEWDRKRQKKIKTKAHDEVIIKLLVQNDGNIYALNNFGHLYQIYLKTKENVNILDSLYGAEQEEKKNDDDETENENVDINKLIHSMDEQCPNFKVGRKKGNYGQKQLAVIIHKDDPNKQNGSIKFSNKCNQKLLKHSLIGLRVINKFNVKQINNKSYIAETLFYGIYYDYNHKFIGDKDNDDQKESKRNYESKFGSVLYLCQQGYGSNRGWNVNFMFNGVNEDSVSSYKQKYNSFIERNQYLLKEQCECMFVDDTKILQKRMMIICGKYLVVIPLLNIHNDKEDRDDHDNNDEFGSVYPLREILPNLQGQIRGAKFVYSYAIQTLFIFERLSSSSKNPFKLTRIGLDSFQFDAYQRKQSKQEL